MDNVVTRVAPSPTGKMHIGTARTALFNFLYARHNGGKFIVRIEDTDPSRDKPEFETDIFENLAWLGIEADETHRQSDNQEKHAAAIKKLIDGDNAYVSEEPSRDDAERIVQIVRFKNPRSTVTFNDLLHGDISVDTSDLGDFVIARSLTHPVHHLAVVVDDADMGVTLAMRGEDLLSNTPRQILIQEALGYSRLQYAHLPLILAPDKTKLSKRRHPVSMGDYRERGYLPEAVVNFLAFLGWNPGTDREIFSMTELIETFDMPGIQKSAAIFNEEKLRWFNRQYLLNLPEAVFAKEANSVLRDSISERALPWREYAGGHLTTLLNERISVWEDIRTLVREGEFDYFFAVPELKATAIPGKGDDAPSALAHLKHVRELLEPLSQEEFQNADRVKEVVWEYAMKEGRGSVLWPLRYSLSGKERSPDPFSIIAAIGKEDVLLRIDNACKLLQTS